MKQTSDVSVMHSKHTESQKKEIQRRKVARDDASKSQTKTWQVDVEISDKYFICRDNLIETLIEI